MHSFKVKLKLKFMPEAHHASYNLGFKPKIIAEAEAVVNNIEIAVDKVLQVNLISGQNDFNLG